MSWSAHPFLIYVYLVYRLKKNTLEVNNGYGVNLNVPLTTSAITSIFLSYLQTQQLKLEESVVQIIG